MVWIYFQVCLPLWPKKIFRFTLFKLLEKAFVKVSPLHDLIIRSHVKWLPLPRPPPQKKKKKSLKKVCSPMWNKIMAFQAEVPSQCFEVKQYGYEIFQTVLRRSCKIMQLKAFNLVINLSLTRF